MGCCGIENKREQFIENFKKKQFDESLNDQETRNGIFIKTQKKIMKISSNSINIEEEVILTLKSDSSNTFSDNFWFLMDCKVNDLKSKEIYVDDKKVDDSKFETRDYYIKIIYEKIFNGQIRKIRVIEEIETNFINYNFQKLLLNEKDVLVHFLIYGEDNIIIDDITNLNYRFDKNLNLAYFEGKTTSETVMDHGFINYSKKIENYQIYKLIPEFKRKEEEIITNNKNNIKERSITFLAIYKEINITEYGQDIEEIFKVHLLNYDGGIISSSLSHGLMLDTKFDVDLVELNGKKTEYTKGNASIQINNFGALNNQFAEFHFKYKYYTNEDKSIIRQESIITKNTKNTYCKLIVKIPDNYAVFSSKEIFHKKPKKNNIYFYNGISNEEQLYELFKFSFKKASWDIHQEFTLEAKENIEKCKFSMNRIYKGGNLKENEFEVILDNGEYIDDEKEDKFIFNFKDLNTNKTTIKLKLKVDNSISDYKFIEKKELITKIPEEDKQFFKDLSNKIINEDKSNMPNYKKIGNWVYNYLKYDLSFYGKTYTAKEIYNNKSGVCKHYTLLYNTLLVSQGIDAINISGYALNITENNIIKENENNKGIPNEPDTLTNSRHVWTLAKIDGEWIPLDATWNMFDKIIPVTHIFRNYGNMTLNTLSNENNPVDNKITKEVIKYIKNNN